MISFQPSDEQEMVRLMAADFAADILRPLARQVDENRHLDQETLDRIWGLGVIQSMIDETADAAVPAQSAILSTLLLEELGWADAVFGMALAAPLGFVRAIAEQGSASQKEALLPLFGGDRYNGAAVALAEPGLLTNTTDSYATEAVSDPDGYRLKGAKLQVPQAERCSHFLVLAQHDGCADAFIVAADTPGVVIGPSDGALGLLGLDSRTVRFNDVKLSADARLGGNQGCNVQRIVDSGRVGASAILVGLSRAVYEHSVAYTKEREAHGSALARKQSVAFRLVDMFTEVEAARWMCWRAATHLDKRGPATRSASLAHIYTREQATWISDEGVQLMGGHGFMRANPVELWYRNAKTLSMLEGVASV